MARKKPAEPWERQPGENAKAFDAFCCYRDMPPSIRSIRRVVEQKEASERTIKDWKKKYDWDHRAGAWDDELDRQALLERMEDIAEMHKRHIRLSEKIIAKVEDAVDSIDADQIKPSEMARLIEVASKLERLSRGDSGEVIEARDGGKSINPVSFYMPDNHRGDNGEEEE